MKYKIPFGPQIASLPYSHPRLQFGCFVVSPFLLFQVRTHHWVVAALRKPDLTDLAQGLRGIRERSEFREAVSRREGQADC